MEKNTQSLKVKEAFLLILLPLLAYIRVLVNLSGPKIKEGLILYLQDEDKKELLLELFIHLGCIEGAITGQRIPDGKNYDLVFVEYHSFQKPETINKYLTCRDYLPVLIVNGIFPETLNKYRNIISLDDNNIAEISRQDLSAIMCDCRDYADKHADDIINTIPEIINFAENISNDFSPQIHMALLTTAYVIHKCLQIDDNSLIKINQARTWIDSLSIIDISERLEFCGVLRKTLENFVDVHSSEIKIGNINMVDSSLMPAIIEEKCILFDEKKYYFPDSLFERITQKLHNTISYPRIKQELFSKGVLSNDLTLPT